MAFCKGCGKTIEWHKTVAGKNIPIDPDPDPKGNIYFRNARAVYGAPGSQPKMYVAHFVTCPKADQFRKPKAFICEVDSCEIDAEHTHCFECNSTEHLAENCPEGG